MNFVIKCSIIIQNVFGVTKIIENIKKYLHQKWRYIIIFIILIILSAGIICSFIINKASGIKDALTNSLILSNIYYITQIVTSIAVIIGGIIGIWQYTLTKRAERIKMNVDRIQKAIDLAEYYKNNILDKYSIISFVFEESGLKEIINKIDKDKMRIFDYNELNKLLSKNEMKQIEQIRNSSKFIQSVIEADKIFGLDLNVNRYASISIDNETQEKKIIIDGTVILMKFMGNIVTEILNNLEFFAMHFSHEIADESVVYQSLHQTYLEIVYALYYNIAIKNEFRESKYFTNIIELYEKWNTKDKSEMNDKIKARTYSQKGATAEKI